MNRKQLRVFYENTNEENRKLVDLTHNYMVLRNNASALQIVMLRLSILHDKGYDCAVVADNPAWQKASKMIGRKRWGNSPIKPFIDQQWNTAYEAVQPYPFIACSHSQFWENFNTAFASLTSGKTGMEATMHLLNTRAVHGLHKRYDCLFFIDPPQNTNDALAKLRETKPKNHNWLWIIHTKMF